jgi:SAM-dependent methyltransferase
VTEEGRIDRLKTVARRVLPPRIRQPLRELVHDFPYRLHDLPRDLRERLLRSPDRLPPARLRRRVGLTSSRAEFVDVGERACADILRAYREVNSSPGDDGRWLDFGCGSGRMLVPLRRAGIEDLRGVDVDQDAIRWLRRRYGRERFIVSPARPPLSFPSASFDVVLAISVFSHMDEEMQVSWLAEMARLLRPGGLLIASTHGRDLVVTRGDLGPAEIERLDRSGFLFAPGGGPFNEDSAFHTPQYLARTWGRWFECRASLPRGLMGYQDLSIWERRAWISRGRRGA